MYNKSINNIYNMDDLLVSKNFITLKKITYRQLKYIYDVKCLFKYILSNHSNASIFLMFISTGFFFMSFDNIKLIKGNTNRILYVRFLLSIFVTSFFFSSLYYFTKFQNLKDFMYSRLNIIAQKFNVFFSFICFNFFLKLYITDEMFLDIIEDNYLFILENY